MNAFLVPEYLFQLTLTDAAPVDVLPVGPGIPVPVLLPVGMLLSAIGFAYLYTVYTAYDMRLSTLSPMPSEPGNNTRTATYHRFEAPTIPQHKSMARLLPTRTDATIERSDNPAVLTLDDDATQEVIEVLSSDTAYEIFRPLNNHGVGFLDTQIKEDLYSRPMHIDRYPVHPEFDGNAVDRQVKPLSVMSIGVVPYRGRDHVDFLESAESAVHCRP